MKKSKKPEELLPTRASLLNRLKNWDDANSWQEFFDMYWGLIYGVAIKSGLSDAEAQDVVQETVIAASKHIKEFKYDPSRSFKGWLCQTARWRIIDQRRKRLPAAKQTRQHDDQNPRTATVEKIADPAAYDLDAKWDAEWQEHLKEKALEKIRNRVKPDQYQVFDASVIKAWPIEKVKATFMVSEENVRQIKSRISKLLKTEIARIEKKIV